MRRILSALFLATEPWLMMGLAHARGISNGWHRDLARVDP